MADLQGPKIRVGKFDGGKTMLERRRRSSSSTPRCTELGTSERVGLDYKELPRDVKARRHAAAQRRPARARRSTRSSGEEVHTTVVVGGELSNNKGINKAGGGLTAPALTAKDMEDIKTAMSLPVRVPRGELPEERDRHGDGAPARQRRRREVAPQAAADRQDRAQRGDPGARVDPQGERRHHGRARRPRGRGRQRGGAGAAEADDQDGARDGPASSSPRRR